VVIFATKAARPTRILASLKRAGKTYKDGYLPVGLTNLPKNNHPYLHLQELVESYVVSRYLSLTMCPIHTDPYCKVIHE
jgi:hypothetical protein